MSYTVIRNQSQNADFKSLKLSPCDWIMPRDGVWIYCIYFYDIKQWPFYGKKENNEFMNVDRLISSLTKLVEYYPFLTGICRIEEKDKTVSIVLNDDKGGIIIKSVSINIPLCDVPLSINEYTNTIDLDKSLELTSKNDVNALFHVHHTRFLCGGVALAIRLNHAIVDAHSYFQLVSDWTRIYQNLEYRPIVCHTRSLLELTEIDNVVDKHSRSSFNKQKTYVVEEDLSPQTKQSVQSIVKIFRFCADELERMKREATAHLSVEVDHVSTFDALAAHLYRHVAIARDSSHSYISKLCIPVNIRSRLKQPIIPSTYFGNAIVHSCLETESTNLIRINDLGFWASQVHQAVATLTSDEIKSTLAWIISQPDKSKIVLNFPFDNTGFYITAWNKMGMYANSNFEHSVHPCRITMPFEQLDNGGAYFFSTEKNDTSIDVILILDPRTMEKLENNSDFRKYG
ncbi:unnamed protein product [Didymodactylos carnosus]|uniref:Uncharacterized protein n=1 Tax=Didymodactylos carnosus TaxID=1234261 RepID=A0A815XF15_9BILA|nr:unnamed protein product [Didymodactylos carnosus]CAF1556913.1 unnamed protein product [Didymodactylos carnosus]CAF3879005.1 unnamed protein product [Didymodactylos carnosus]CAF4418110.1 unnamed protein product [Didymodactylos carnosus]